MPMTLPASELARLKHREQAQRAETKRRGLPVEMISVEALWLLQRGVCGCKDRCGTLNPVAQHGDDDHIIIGHLHARSLGGGHTIHNVFLQRAGCNHTAAALEKSAKAKRTKHIPDKARRQNKSQGPKRKIPSRPMRRKT